MRMESSEEEDDFPSIESVTPQSKIDTTFQSKTEKGIRKICFELLDLKDAVENLCGNTRTKYGAFLRLCEESVEMEHELSDLRKNISPHGILLQDLMSGVCQDLDQWAQVSSDVKGYIWNTCVVRTLKHPTTTALCVFISFPPPPSLDLV